MKFNIAIGKSRKEINWRNKEVEWPELVKKISDTHRTAETHAVYLASKKPRQDEIKDVGGFVGGYLQGGRRKAGSVMNRQLLTLDLDFANYDFWDDFSLYYGCTAALYSTHKHSLDNPRYRLVIPLNREVFPEEYEAIARRVAGNLGIELFDPSTFQPERLMYWPSTSKDGDWVFHSQTGDWLDADTVLSEYTNWRDTSEWPVSDKVGAVIKRSMQKQGDPTEKTGVVGAFCRSYTIHEVLDKFLSDVYDSCDIENRFTFKEGSTSAGLVVYEDKWAYSHHGTDPVGGKLCNAFDLVRLHKFGLKDEDVKEGTPGNKLPSYMAMLDFAAGDTKVRKQIGAEKIQDALKDFSGVLVDDEGEFTNDDWMAEMEADRHGNYESSINNIYLVLKNSPGIKGRLLFDEFENRLIVVKDLPWRKVTEQTKDFTDDDEDCLAHYLENLQVPFTQLPRGLSKIRNEFRFHPVREYLSRQAWDGVNRLDTLLIDYLGAEDSAYTRAVIRKTLLGAVARVFTPGVKFDTCMTLVGPKGIFKSQIIARLFGDWFSDTMGDIHDKSGMENLRGVWGMEIAELDAFKRADIDAIKRFITSQVDMYRPAYGKQVVRFPRQCIFIPTTNKFNFLPEADERRFLPVLCRVNLPTKNVWTELDETEVGQIWAEVMEAYHAGESLDLSAEVKLLAEKVREQHTSDDDREGLIDAYLDLLLPEDWEGYDIYKRRDFLRSDESLQPAGTVKRTRVCVAEIWCEVLGGHQKDMSNHNTKFIHDIMRKKKNWEVSRSSRKFSLYGKQKCYEMIQKVALGG